ncbi:hypothetical protein KJ780_02925 [Candidatus Micrarchaeota archaeon]|nr:hypothetical protein [Candidatus Micrarchaeota archaeon]
MNSQRHLRIIKPDAPIGEVLSKPQFQKTLTIRCKVDKFLAKQQEALQTYSTEKKGTAKKFDSVDELVIHLSDLFRHLEAATKFYPKIQDLGPFMTKPTADLALSKLENLALYINVYSEIVLDILRDIAAINTMYSKDSAFPNPKDVPNLTQQIAGLKKALDSGQLNRNDQDLFFAALQSLQTDTPYRCVPKRINEKALIVLNMEAIFSLILEIRQIESTENCEIAALSFSEPTCTLASEIQLLISKNSHLFSNRFLKEDSQ